MRSSASSFLSLSTYVLPALLGFALMLSGAPALPAQSPLTTTFANNNGGSPGGAIYFELECLDPAGVTITDLDLNFASGVGSAGSIDVLLKPDGSYVPHTSSGWVGPASTGTVAASAVAGQPTHVVLNPPLPLGAGAHFGVAIVAHGLAHAYTNATGTTTYANTELELTAGGASNVPFAGTLLTPRVPNVRLFYTSGGSNPPIASAEPHGAGCLAQSASFYESLAAASFDLAGGTLLALPLPGGGYGIAALTPGQVLPLGTIGAPGMLPLADNAQNAAGTLGLVVGSNGWVAFGSGNSNAGAPSAAVALANPATAIYAWTDLDPAASGGGRVWYEENPATGTALITFDGVYGAGTTSANTVQFFVDANTHLFAITWGAVSPSNPTGWLVGYSNGGPSIDPGSVDLSQLVAPAVLTTPAADVPPVSLTAVGRPVLGANPTPFRVTTGNIPANVLSQIGLIGASSPGAPLAAIGLPGCFLHASLDRIDFVLAPPVAPPSYTWTAVMLPPATPALNGIEFYVQAVVFGTPLNSYLSIGALTSNGLECTLGTL